MYYKINGTFVLSIEQESLKNNQIKGPMPKYGKENTYATPGENP